MHGLRKSKNFILFGLALMAAFFLVKVESRVAVAAETTGSISVSCEVEGVTFSLYKIGVMNGGTIELTGDFAEYAVDMDSIYAAQTLETYVKRDKLTPIATAAEQGKKAIFDNLANGVYLICGSTKTVGNIRYTAVPCLVNVSVVNDDDDKKDIDVQCKFEQEKILTTTDISVVIIWKDSGFEQERPPRLTILLLKDGEPVDEVELSEENNWSHKWEDLDGEYEWVVVEESVTEDYEVITEKDGRTYIITKKKDGDEKPVTPPADTPTNPPDDSAPDSPDTPTTPPGEATPESPDTPTNPPDESTPDSPDTPTTPPSEATPEQPSTSTPAPEVTPSVAGPSGTVSGQLPQTGQLWWPVYTLVCVGLLFVIIGVLCKRRDCQ